jgi:hypothetical protein
MTPEELQIAVEKALGWSREPHRNCDCGKMAWYDPQGGAHMRDSVPSWPEDLSAAWELVEDAEAAGVGFELSNIHKDILTAKWLRTEWAYDATFFDPIGGPVSLKYKAEDLTAPLAICRAWLFWKTDGCASTPPSNMIYLRPDNG